PLDRTVVWALHEASRRLVMGGPAIEPASAGGSAHDEPHRIWVFLVVSFRCPPARRGHGRHCKRPRRNTLSIKTKLIGGISAAHPLPGHVGRGSHRAPI